MSQRLEAACIHRNLVVDQRPEDVQHRGLAHGRRRIEIRRLLRTGAAEVDGGLARGLVDRYGHGDRRAGVHLVLEVAVREHIEHAAHCFLGVVLHVSHVGANQAEAEMRDHAFQFADTAGARRRPEPADRPGSGRYCVMDTCRNQAPRASRPREIARRRRAGCCPAARLPRRRRSSRAASNPAWCRRCRRGDPGSRRRIPVGLDPSRERFIVEEDGGDHRDVRQMRAAVVRRVQHERVTRLHRSRARRR